MKTSKFFGKLNFFGKKKRRDNVTLHKSDIRRAKDQGWSFNQVSTHKAIFFAPPYTHSLWKTPIDWEQKMYRKCIIMAPKSFPSVLL